MSCGVRWGMASHSHPDEHVLGDGYLVKPLRHGMLVAVADGLGHGPEAAAASAIAIETIAEHAEAPISTILKECHERLRGTRGATVSVVVFDYVQETMHWSGVGDVAAVLLRAANPLHPRSLVRRAGVLGSGTPSWVVSGERLHCGDIVVIASDGVEAGFDEEIAPTATEQRVAESILARYGKGTDDALVLVTRYGGATP